MPPSISGRIIHRGFTGESGFIYLSKRKKGFFSVETVVVESYVENPVKPSRIKGFPSTGGCGQNETFPQVVVKNFYCQTFPQRFFHNPQRVWTDFCLKKSV